MSVVLRSRVDPTSETFAANQRGHAELAADLQAQFARVHTGGGPRSRERHLGRGKLLPRDRVAHLIDRGSPFLEFSTLAAHGMYEDQAPGAGIITGIGRVEGREVVIVCNDATVKGGSYYPMTARKHTRAQEIALQNRLPCIYLVDSGGGYIPLWPDLFPDVRGFGQSFYNQARMSALGLAQISAVMGSCTAGGAYLPSMSDETVIVRRQGLIFLGGPPLVKAATGEDVDAESLGGGEMHTKVSGVADHLAVDDEDALAIVRSIVATLPTRGQTPWETVAPEPPAVDMESLTGAVPVSIRTPYDPREIIARIVDGSRFHEFKARYGPTLVTGFAHLHGHQVGIIANQGVIFSSSAKKGAHFIELCDQRGIPLIFLQNITGFMVGLEAEEGGIAKDGAKLIAAVSVARVPRLTVIVGASYGAGTYGMSGRPYFPRFVWMWPNARVGLMGGDQAADVMATVSRETDPEKVEAGKDEIRAQFEAQTHPYYASARLWDDGVIDPRSTRDVLGLALSACANAPLEDRLKPVFRM
ncbi:methylcrotonoyl-CoA carboxylase [Baekduia soli]|uniref:Methylcrotonoyl-CoA carboxylase n=1 Tax=Baekduia soli TaxID=496014 RepID=A0A5B8U099_9ACTN|nr:carboxyl transferase domain-containing protein [Baekduia soli]QEC46390.1 methylcrotonoyl-CoA carboxylase [Baekduia soli]